MDTLKTLFELLKNNAYEVLAVLLPGAILVEVLKRLFAKADEALRFLLTGKAEIKYIALIYVVGTVLQGLVRALTDREFFRKYVLGSSAAVAALRSSTATALQLTFSGGDDLGVKASATVGVALSKIDDKRSVYDKFTALRDMARGLFAAMLASIAALLVALKSTDLTLEQGGGALLGFMFGSAGSLLAYRRYAPLAEEAVYSQVLASKLPVTVTIPVPAVEPAGPAPAPRPQV